MLFSKITKLHAVYDHRLTLPFVRFQYCPRAAA